MVALPHKDEVKAMTIRSILVPLAADAADRRGLVAAGRLAQRFDAHVTALYVEPDPDDLLMAMASAGGGAYFSDEIVRSIKQQGETRRAAAERTFTQWQAGSSVPLAAKGRSAGTFGTELAIAVGPIESVTRDYALVADLVVTVVPGKGEIDRRILLESALIDAGRPLLALPPDGAMLEAVSRAAIAWNGSIEASRAVSAALPLLQGAAEVRVLHAGEAGAAGSLDQVVAFLAWHGVPAAAQELGAGALPSDLIAAEVETSRADLLVMGAYTHSRVRELVLGGVTRDMLDSAPVPLLLSH